MANQKNIKIESLGIYLPETVLTTSELLRQCKHPPSLDLEKITGIRERRKAVLSHANENEGFLAFRLYSDGRGKYSFTVPAGGSENPASTETVNKKLHYFQMDGREVYKTAINVLPKAIKKVLDDTGLTVNDIDYMIPHQPGIMILKNTAEILGLPFEKVMTNMDKYANTSAGTIPILLDEANRAGKLKKGNIILFAAVGAGWTWGASIIKWS